VRIDCIGKQRGNFRSKSHAKGKEERRNSSVKKRSHPSCAVGLGEKEKVENWRGGIKSLKEWKRQIPHDLKRKTSSTLAERKKRNKGVN